MRLRIFLAVVIVLAAGCALAGAAEPPCNRILIGETTTWGSLYLRCLMGKEYNEKVLQATLGYFQNRVARGDLSKPQDVVDFINFIKDKRTQKQLPNICNILRLLIITKPDEYKDFCKEFGCQVESAETVWPTSTVTPAEVQSAPPAAAIPAKAPKFGKPTKKKKKQDTGEEPNEGEPLEPTPTPSPTPPGTSSGKGIGRLMNFSSTNIILSFIAILGVVCIVVMFWIVWELTKLRKELEGLPNMVPQGFDRWFKIVRMRLDRIEVAIIQQIGPLQEVMSQLVGSLQTASDQAASSPRPPGQDRGYNHTEKEVDEVIIPFGSSGIPANDYIRVSTTTSSPGVRIEKIADVLVSAPDIKSASDYINTLKDGRLIRSGVIGDPAMPRGGD
ncbi:MAG: hypothetical protein HQK60_09290, partial [Deltaproteobacteria bacterium]|nr:hypothetical protein [Deltaproteobacteria bacterium]